MVVTRRDFLKYCSTSAAAVGLTSVQLESLANALDGQNAPTVLWLQGSSCTGCSISFLNYVSSSAPYDPADVLINVVNLAYHPNLMASAGETAVDTVRWAIKKGGYVLVVEGGVPTAFGGNACWAGTTNGHDITFASLVTQLADRAGAIVCVGTCSSWGGMFSAPPNPTGVKSVSAHTGKTTINIPGCPPHPDWIVWAVAQLVAGTPVQLDNHGRPTALFNRRVHETCPLRPTQECKNWGNEDQCKEELGCRGKDSEVLAPCPQQYFNDSVNWCIGAGSHCIGCVDPKFPGAHEFFEEDL